MAGAVVLFMAGAVGTAVTLKSNQQRINNETQGATSNPSLVTKSRADTLAGQALQASQNNETDKARSLFQEAQQLYTDLNDANSATDMAAQLYIIDHTKTPPEAITPPAVTITR